MSTGVVFRRDDNSVPVVGIIDESGNPKQIQGIDGLSNPIMGVMCYVWDTDTGTLAKMTQPQTTVNVAGDFLATIGDLEALGIGNYFKDVRYDYDANGDCIYKGMHTDLGAATSDTGWYIIRYDYDVNQYCERKRFRITSWDNRTSGW